MREHIDFIIISQSDFVDYEGYSKLPIDRIELYSELVFPRMVYFKGGFRSHMDIINYFRNGKLYSEATGSERKNMLNIWNLPGFNGIHLANYLLQYGIRTEIINNLNTEWDDFCRKYSSLEVRPLVGISTTFHLSYSSIQKIVKKLRTVDENMEIVVGGAFINEKTINGNPGDFESAARKNKINYFLFGFNSEKDLAGLIQARKKHGGYESVTNLAYIEGNDLENGAFIMTNSIWNLPEFGGPFLFGKIDMPFVNKTIQLRTSSGCAFNCSFCSYPQTAKGFHAMDLEKLDEQFRSLKEITRIKNLIFIDDTFNIPIERFREICKLLLKYDFEWFSFLRVQFVNEEIAKLMKDSGCKAVYLGVESSSDVILQNMNKKATKSQFIDGIKILKKHGIISLAAFIVGFPGENDATIRENIEFIEKTGIDFYTLKEFYYMKHAPIYLDRDKYALSGAGSEWKHKTMDSKTASKKKLGMFELIKNSIFVDPDTSLWHIAYLYDQGYSIDSIKDYQAEINRIMLNQISGKFNDSDIEGSKFRQFV